MYYLFRDTLIDEGDTVQLTIILALQTFKLFFGLEIAFLNHGE